MGCWTFVYLIRPGRSPQTANFVYSNQFATRAPPGEFLPRLDGLSKIDVINSDPGNLDPDIFRASLCRLWIERIQAGRNINSQSQKWPDLELVILNY
jgi:hypothetical protein